MKGRKILLAFIISAITLTSGCANGTSKTEEAKSEQKTTEENGVVPIKPITEKAIDDNPYMAKSDANVHQDCYNSDTTDEVLPVDIYPEINVSYEKVNPNASPAVFFDTYGHAVVPFQGGLAIRDINADETQTEGYFSPANTTVAIRMKGIAGKADTFTLYAYDKENKLKEVPAELWHIQEEDGTLPDKLTEDTLYEVHVMVEDGGEFDLSDTEKEIKIAVILGNK